MFAMTTSEPTTLRVETLPFRGSALAQAMYTGGLPEAIGARSLRGAKAFVSRGRALLAQYGASERAQLASWIEAATGLQGRDGAAAARLRDAVAGGLVVTTGQQPGLLGGPLYTWHKALSAIALADALSEQLDVPVAPIFWAATDDADFAEGASTVFPTASGSVRAAWPVSASSGGVPVSAVPLPDMTEVLVAFEGACGSAADGSIRRAVLDAYGNGASVGEAYLTLLRALLEPRGMAVIDASHPALRSAGHAVAVRALERSALVDQALAMRTAAMTSAGFAPQVELVQGLSLVFRWSGNGKLRVPIAESSEWTQAPVGSLSGNVLLRPVIESAILPTVAYVAGPGELSYFAQVDVVAEALGTRTPAAAARWSARVIESRVAEAAAVLGRPLDAFADRDAVMHAIAAAELPAPLGTALHTLRTATKSALAQLADAATELDLAPTVIPGAERQLLQRIERIERRLVARAAAQDQSRRARVELVAGSVFPGGVPQERALNALPLLARHGEALWSAWADGARAWATGLLAEPSDP
jgi:bacillithiol synthase